MEPPPEYAECAGAKVAYHVHGAGPDLVIVPGFVSHIELQWSDPEFRRYTRSLGRVARLIRFDKLGTGLSDPVTVVPNLSDRVQELEAVIQSSGADRPFVFGFSEGGPIAIEYAAARPNNVRGLILYGTSPRRPPEWALRPLREAAEHWGDGRLASVVAPSTVGSGRAARATFERAAASPAMARALVESLATTDVMERLSDVRAPTLVLHRHDDFVPLMEAEVMAAGIPGARLVVLEGNDHLPWLGEIEPLVSEVAGFITELVPPSPRAKAGTSRERRPVVGWASLTPAEMRVAKLAGEGLRNADIADRLFVSRYTVETHVKRIFTKLGLESRAQLITLVVRQQE